MPSANNDFANAEVISGASGTSAFFTIDTNTIEAGEPIGLELENPPAHQTCWFKWTCPATDYYAFDTFQSTTADAGSMDGFGNLDTTMAVWTGTILSDLSPITSNDDFSGSHWWSKCRFLATVGVVYYIQVGTFDDGYIGDVKLAWDDGAVAPANDLFQNPELLTGDADSTTGALAYASAEAGEDFWKMSVWYKWTPSTDRDVTLTGVITSTNDDDFFRLEVWNGTQISSLIRRSVCDAFPGGFDDAVCVFRAIAGEDYYFSVSGDTRGNGEPTFSLDLASAAAAAAPANDNFASATVIPQVFTPAADAGPPASVSVFYTGSSAGAQSTANARHQVGERPTTGIGGFSNQRNGDQSVWYKVTTPSWRANVTVTRPANALVAIYQGTSVDSLTLITEASSGGTITFVSDVSEDYYISVAGAPNTGGTETNNTNFTMTVSCLPIIAVYNPSLEYRGSTTVSTGPTISTTIAKPAGTAAGDVVLLFLVRKVAAGGGFDLMAGHEFCQINFGGHISYEFSAVDVYMKIAGESEPASYTLAQTSGSAYWCGIMASYSTSPNIWRQGLDSDMWSGFAAETQSEIVSNPPDVTGGSEDFLSDAMTVTGEGLLLQWFEGQTQHSATPTAVPATTIDTGSPTLRGEETIAAVPSNNTVSARLRSTEESFSGTSIPAVKTTVTWGEDLTFHSPFVHGDVASNIRRLYLGGVVKRGGSGARRDAELPKTPRAVWKDHPYRLRTSNG